MKKIFTIFILAIGISFSLVAQNSLNTTFVGQWGYGACAAVAESGDYVYVNSGNMLLVIDKTIPSTPQKISELFLPSSIMDIQVSGSYAYIADLYSGLRIIDISNPASLQEVGSYDTPGDANGVAINGNYAYIADGADGLCIIDISNPASPQETGFYDTPGYAEKVAVNGNYAYIGDGDEGLCIVDISNPASPQETGFYDTPGHAEGVTISGNYAYIADNDYGLRIIDIGNPANPQETGYYDTPGIARGVAISGNYAYVTDNEAGLRIINISNPASPQETGFYNTPGFARGGIAISGNYAYIADALSGLCIIDVSNSADPQEVGSYPMPQGYARDMAVSGNYAYIANSEAGLYIIDISNPINPQKAGSYNTPGSANGVVINGNYAYIADNEAGLRIINISNPINPQEVGSYDTPGFAVKVAINGNYAYIADESNGLRIIDISNPANPQEVGFYDTSGDAGGIAVSGDYAYIADGYSGLVIVNISNPANPQEVGSYFMLGYAQGVAINGNYAYIADSWYGLYIVDISDPYNPQHVGNYNSWVEGVVYDGNYAYLIGNGLRIFDVNNPANPYEVGFYNNTSLVTCGVGISGEYAYIANGYDGMSIVRNDLLVGYSINGIVSYANASNTPLNDITIDLKNNSGAVVASATTDDAGGYSFNDVPYGNYTFQVTATKPWNGVSASDVLLYKKHIANISPLTGIYYASGDVNASGSLTAADVLLIKKRIATIINSFTVGDWLFNNDTLSINGSNVTYNFNGLVYGDANGSYIPTKADLSAVKEQGIISMETVNDSNGEIAVPVHVSDMPNLGAFQFTIAYDPGKIQFTGVDHWYDGINDVTVGNTAPGQLTFVWAADDRGINIADGTLCNLRFTTKTSGQSTLSFENNPTLKEFSDYEGNLFEPKYTNGVVGSTTGISEQNLTEISVYPNPSNGTFTLELISVKSQNFDVTVYNPLGVAVYQQLNVAANGKYSTEIGSGDLPEGIYTLTVTGKDTNYIKKIVIRK